MSKRTDIHSPSNIVPQDYRYLLSFCNGQNAGTFGFPINAKEIMEIRRARPRDFANIHGGNYDCDICGKSYNEGELWEHIETKELITLGHICAESYHLCADDAEFEAEKAKAVRQRARQAKMEAKQNAIAELFEDNKGLREAFEAAKTHPIVSDIHNRLMQYGNLSEKQIALVIKIATQQVERATKQEQEFINVPRIAGRQTIIGKVVATKYSDFYIGYGQYRGSVKGLFIVDTPQGQWKTWGTISDTLFDGVNGAYQDFIKGKTIQFDAVVKVADNDPKMSFFSRPSKASIVESK